MKMMKISIFHDDEAFHVPFGVHINFWRGPLELEGANVNIFIVKSLDLF